MLISVWRYRHFILASIKGELRGRFARSRLGAIWFILHPLAQALIFSIVLAEVMRAKMPNMTSPAAYPIYLLSGMAAWGLFSEILTRSMNVFIEQAPTLKKISFPRLWLALILILRETLSGRITPWSLRLSTQAMTFSSEALG